MGPLEIRFTPIGAEAPHRPALRPPRPGHRRTDRGHHHQWGRSLALHRGRRARARTGGHRPGRAAARRRPGLSAGHPRHADPVLRRAPMTERTPPTVTADSPIGPDVDLDTDDVRLPDGTRLTGQHADEIVEEVRRRAGRPSLTGQPAVSPRIAFRVTPDVRDRAAGIAAREGKTISQLAREALEARVAGAEQRP